jgi:hypothetical protein
MAVRNISRSFFLALEAYTYINLLPESASTDTPQHKASKEQLKTHRKTSHDVCLVQRPAQRRRMHPEDEN